MSAVTYGQIVVDAAAAYDAYNDELSNCPVPAD